VGSGGWGVGGGGWGLRFGVYQDGDVLMSEDSACNSACLMSQLA
jgi:hypothetical protein